MKKIIFIIIIYILPVLVNAEVCSTEQLSKDKELANKLQINYKKVEPFINDYNIEYGKITIYDMYDVTIKNFDKQLYITINDGDYKNLPTLTDDKGSLEYSLYGGKYTYHIYSLKCNKLLRDITIFYPKYNYFSYYKECKGPRSILKICKKNIKENELEYYESKSKSDFDKIMKEYDESNIFGKAKFYINDYYIIFTSLALLLLIITLILIIKLLKLFMETRKKK
ncbi:MAG: hypothetical protein RSD96_02125 [Bacilli bacterium]